MYFTCTALLLKVCLHSIFHQRSYQIFSMKIFIQQLKRINNCRESGCCIKGGYTKNMDIFSRGEMQCYKLSICTSTWIMDSDSKINKIWHDRNIKCHSRKELFKVTFFPIQIVLQILIGVGIILFRLQNHGGKYWSEDKYCKLCLHGECFEY